MKKIFLNLLLIAFSFGVYSQSYPSYKEIEIMVTDSLSVYYYPELIKRFNSFDRDLTFEDYVLIYYGFGFQDNYNGYRTDPSSIYYSLYQNGEYEEIIEICDSILQEVPVCISSNFYKSIAEKKLNPNCIECSEYQTRAVILESLLANSGDGKSIETAYKILFFDDEKRIMYGELELEGYSSQTLIGFCDQLKLTKKSKKFKNKYIYFDVWLLFNGLKKQHDKQ
jgi:hypothetical protein